MFVPMLHTAKCEIMSTQHDMCLFCQAQRSDELDIEEGEELEVLEWDDGDGWCKGKNLAGKDGYFPQSYVQPLSRPSSPVMSVPSTVVPTSAASVACSHQMSMTSMSSTLTASSSSPSHAFTLPNGKGNEGGSGYIEN